MKGTAARVARSSLRAWWPEGILVALCSLIWATQNPQNAAAVLIAVGIGWAMGFRHRVLPLHKKVDRITDGVTELLRESRTAARDASEPARPALRVVRD